MAINNDVTISVPEAGRRYFGLSRNAAYDAAARGELPVIRIGRLLRVPVRALDAMLEQALGRRKKEIVPDANVLAITPAGLEPAQ
jgi:excisionase family DNA binding protein